MARKKNVKYTARPNSPISDKEAEIVGEETEAMAAEGVSVTPKAVLDRAKDPKSRLHDLFEWDDKAAAERYRVAWARELLASIQVIEVRTGKPARALYSIVASTEDDEAVRAYYPRRQVLDSDEGRAQLSRDRYRTISSVVRDCESIGLCSEDPAWRRIRQAVETNTPKAMALVAAEKVATSPFA